MVVEARSKGLSDDYGEGAANYALRPIGGTDFITFRDLPSLFASLGIKGRALDLGCGAGRSTRLLQDLGFETTGVDISPSMINAARQQDSRGTYCLSLRGIALPFADASFDLVFSSWVLVEQSNRSEMESL